MLLIFFSIGLKLRSPHIIGTVKLLQCGVQSSLRGPRTLVSSPSHQSITSKWVLNRGTELRSSSKRRDGGRSSRVFVDNYEDQSSRKGVRDSSPMYDDKQSSRRSRHRSRSMTREEDASDDERNFKRRWGRRSSAAVDTRRWVKNGDLKDEVPHSWSSVTKHQCSHIDFLHFLYAPNAKAEESFTENRGKLPVP